MLKSDKVDFRTKKISNNKGIQGHYIRKKESIQQEYTIILESVKKEISGLILSSDSFLAAKWPSFSTEAQTSVQRPSLLAAAMYKTL